MSSEVGGGGGEDPEIDAFQEALETFNEAVSSIEGDSPSANIEAMKAVNAFFASVGEIGPDPAMKRLSITTVADKIPFYNQKEAERQLNKHLRSGSSGAERPEIDALLLSEIEAIEKLNTGEAESEIRYRFIFENGNAFIVDTEALYSPTQFRRAYNSAFDVLPEWHGEQDDWEDLLASLQSDYLVVKTDNVGPRVAAIEQLRTFVLRSEAYLEPVYAIDNNAVFIDAESEEEAEEAPVLWIPSEEVKRVCDENEITMHALRIEMDNRHLRRGRTSERFGFRGMRASFWPLDAEEFEYRGIEFEEAEEESDEN